MWVILQIIKRLVYLQDHDTRTWFVTNFINQNFADHEPAIKWLEEQANNAVLSITDKNIMDEIIKTYRL